jgi:2-oxo-4-hydroxy-4-carboxy--5-ureidoimidazoline (OHCU) decarboxylase
MGSTEFPDIEALSSLSIERRAGVLDLLFEPSPPLHSLCLPLTEQRQFSAYQDLIDAVGTQLTSLSKSESSADRALLDKILGSHPRLGAKKVDSAQSQAEQAQLQGGAEEAEMLRSLNEEYEQTFPGLRYVVFVNGRSRSVVMDNMRARIARGDAEAERHEAIQVSERCSTSLHVHCNGRTDRITPHRPCVTSQPIVQESCHHPVNSSK